MKTAKPLKLNAIRMCEFITRNTAPDAVVYTVAAVRGMNVYLCWYEGFASERMCGQWTDYSDCYPATVEQIRNHVTQCGRLVNGHDIKDLNLV